VTIPVIAGFRRSPFTAATRGRLAKVRPDDMLAQVIAGLLGTAKIDRDDLEDVIVGCAFPEGEQGLNIARTASLLARLPVKTAGATINRFCGSSMQAVHAAAVHVHDLEAPAGPDDAVAPHLGELDVLYVVALYHVSLFLLMLALYFPEPVLPLRRLDERPDLRGRPEGALVTLDELFRRVVVLLAALVLDRVGPRQGCHTSGHLQRQAACQPKDKPAYVGVPRAGRVDEV